MATMMTLAMSVEVSLSQAFARLADEEFHDVSLKGTDGVLVPANRMALSARSDYFKTMFKMGRFKEANNEVVSIGFSSDVLKAIVQYNHTDTGILLAKYSEDATGAFSAIAANHMVEFQTLISLTEAAMYVGLPGLCQKAQDCLAVFVKNKPSLSISILAAYKQVGPVIRDDLASQAWNRFCVSAGELDGTVLGHISASALGAIIHDSKAKVLCRVDNTKLFKLIHSWVQSEPSVPGESKESHLQSAKDLVQSYVKLEFIKPDVLSTLVEPSGLVTAGQVSEAIEKNAQKAKHKLTVRFRQPLVVDLVAWKDASSKTLTSSRNSWKSDVLTVPAIQIGSKYHWRVTTSSVNETTGNSHVWLGVTKSTHSLDPLDFCGFQKDCWGVYGDHGCEYSRNGSGYRLLGEGAKFGAGSCVTMTLDLSARNAGNGTLSISVDDQEPVIAISNMRAHMFLITAGFVPAVSCLRASATIVDAYAWKL